jgi:hypothetical protein
MFASLGVQKKISAHPLKLLDEAVPALEPVKPRMKWVICAVLAGSFAKWDLFYGRHAVWKSKNGAPRSMKGCCSFKLPENDLQILCFWRKRKNAKLSRQFARGSHLYLSQRPYGSLEPKRKNELRFEQFLAFVFKNDATLVLAQQAPGCSGRCAMKPNQRDFLTFLRGLLWCRAI